MNSVTFWHLGHSLPVSGGGGCVYDYADNETVLELTLFELSGRPFDTFDWGIIEGDVEFFDWGDGTINNSKSHTFSELGTYIVKIVGNITHFRLGDTTRSNVLVTKVLNVASSITSFYQSFLAFHRITSIPKCLFYKNVNATNFESVFHGCLSLDSIPSGLFDKNTEVTTFKGAFINCKKITNVPSGLFDKNTKVETFFSVFDGCQGLVTIPEGLFDKNVLVTSFDRAFHDCALTSIPVGLFDKNINVLSFMGTFVGNRFTSVPVGLFDKNVLVTSFRGVFYRSVHLSSVPLDLFDKNINVVDFREAFYWTSITERPKPHGLEMWQIAGTNGRPDSIDVTDLFTSCIRLPDYDSLPSPVIKRI